MANDGFGGPPGGAPPGGSFGVPPAGGFGMPPGGAPGGLGEPPGGVPGGSWSPVDSIQAAFEIIKAKPAEVLLPLILPIVLIGVVNFVASFVSSFASALIQGLVDVQDQGEAAAFIVMGVSFGFELISQLVMAVVQAYVTAGTIVFGLKVLRNEDASIGDIFSGGPYVLPLVGWYLLGGILMGLGYLLCVVPGVILGLGLSMASPLVVDRKLGPIEAMKASWDMTQGTR